MRVIESDPGIGCCGSKMLRYYDWNTIDSTGIVIYQNGNAYDRGREDEKLPNILNQRMKLRSIGADFSMLNRWIITSHKRT